MEILQHDIWLYNMVYIIKLYMILGLSCDLVISDSWKKQLRKWGAFIIKSFGSAEKVSFPVAALEELLTEVFGHCKLVADTLSMPFPGFCSPESVLQPS